MAEGIEPAVASEYVHGGMESDEQDGDVACLRPERDEKSAGLADSGLGCDGATSQLYNRQNDKPKGLEQISLYEQSDETIGEAAAGTM